MSLLAGPSRLRVLGPPVASRDADLQGAALCLCGRARSISLRTLWGLSVAPAQLSLGEAPDDSGLLLLPDLSPREGPHLPPTGFTVVLGAVSCQPRRPCGGPAPLLGRLPESPRTPRGPAGPALEEQGFHHASDWLFLPRPAPAQLHPRWAHRTPHRSVRPKPGRPSPETRLFPEEERNPGFRARHPFPRGNCFPINHRETRSPRALWLPRCRGVTGAEGGRARHRRRALPPPFSWGQGEHALFQSPPDAWVHATFPAVGHPAQRWNTPRDSGTSWGTRWRRVWSRCPGGELAPFLPSSRAQPMWP